MIKINELLYKEENDEYKACEKFKRDINFDYIYTQGLTMFDIGDGITNPKSKLSMLQYDYTQGN